MCFFVVVDVGVVAAVVDYVVVATVAATRDTGSPSLDGLIEQTKTELVLTSHLPSHLVNCHCLELTTVYTIYNMPSLDSQGDRQGKIQAGRQREREANRQTGRQVDIQIDRQEDR